MYKLLLAAGAASLAIAVPAAADPGKNNGGGNQAKHGQMDQGNGNQAKHGQMHQGNGNQTKHGQMHQGNGNQTKQVTHSRHVYEGRTTANFWGGSCPPGLAKKNNGCLPPGIAKRSFNVGDRWNGNYGQWSYNQVPTDWRNQYNLNSYNRYYYSNGYLYSVDPKTLLVEAVIRALIS